MIEFYFRPLQSGTWPQKPTPPTEGGPVPYLDMMARADTFRACYKRAAMKFRPDANGGIHRAEWDKLQSAKGVLDRHFGIA